MLVSLRAYARLFFGGGAIPAPLGRYAASLRPTGAGIKRDGLACTGVALRLPWAVFWRPFRAPHSLAKYVTSACDKKTLAMIDEKKRMLYDMCANLGAICVVTLDLEINMTMNRRALGGLTALVMVAGAFGLSGCGQVDVNTPEGLEKAIKSRQKLEKAIPKVSSMLARPDEMKPLIPALVDLYQDGSSFDREVIQALASSGDALADSAFRKAVKSTDYKQVIQAAYGIKKTGNRDIQNELLGVYDNQKNPDVKRAILETGTAIKNENIARKAMDILNGDLDETPFTLLRTSCDVLAYQEIPEAVETLLIAIYHQDGVGRSLSSNCTKALLALDKDVVGPVLLKAYKLEDEKLQQFVKDHPDTLTNETIRNNTANALALYRYTEAVEPMLDYIADTKTIPVPGTLAIRPNTDPAWQMWASLVGVASQSTLFSLNDIGIHGNQRAKQVLTELFNWTMPYKSKFKNAIELTGSTNIEVSQRVNAYRLLRENDLISNTETLALIEKLKGEEFQNERTFRNWARASIGTDMVTYSAVTSKSGDTSTIWAAFNAMKESGGVFFVPVPEDPDAPKPDHYNDGVSQRIANVKGAFELADKCDTNAECYATALKAANVGNYERIKAVYELGLSGDHKYFEVVASVYKNLDVFGQLYGTKALAQLGTKDDVESIKQLNEKLSKEMNQLQYQTAKTSLEGLITTLKNKK